MKTPGSLVNANTERFEIYYIYITSLLMEKKYRYLGYVLLLLFPLIFAGFYQTYFRNFPFADRITYFEHLHAFIATVWVLLLVIQPIRYAIKITGYTKSWENFLTSFLRC